MEHRLDLQHGAHHGGGGGDAAAPLEEVQVIHRELVAQLQLVGLCPVPNLLDGLALGALLGGQINKQPLPQRGTQSIHGVQLSIRVFFPEILHGNYRGAVCGGQAGGEGQHQDVAPLLQQGLQRLGVLGHIDGGGGGHLAGTEHLIKGMGLHLPVVGVVVIYMVLNGEAQGQNTHVQLLDQIGPQIGGGICQDNEIGHRHSGHSSSL